MPRPSENVSEYEIVPQADLSEVEEVALKVASEKNSTATIPASRIDRVALWASQTGEQAVLFLSSLANVYTGADETIRESHARKGISIFNRALIWFSQRTDSEYTYQLRRETVYVWARKKRKRD